ncbi:hypothetical protein RA280_15365 [Cupriavidus sp. CV2]|uniref:hypothetical protein n=1 Tax=Cupriavidus ulmosensis TaxID=3065913 RepID=UPI00296ACE49|nr:hypothetical protein [Cupriavidus sp. CV2]MDW3683104.1 hypothetical protein [Cupriavidus sp. CV2]
MSFIYPRTVAITRPNAQTGVGAVGYGGLVASAETAVASALPASIQLDRTGRKPDAGLPGDAAGKTLWKVFIPAASAAKGLIQARDVLKDDLGIRYQVTAPYWNSLGYALLVERLEA